MADAQPIEQFARHLGQTRQTQGLPIDSLAHAAQNLLAAGLDWPSSRQEAWRYTPVAKFTTPKWRPAAESDGTFSEPAALAAMDGHRLVFIDGLFHAAWSTPFAGSGMWVGSLAEARAARPELLRAALGAQNLHQTHTLAALNTAGLEHGAVVHIEADTVLPKSVHVVYLQSGSSKHPTLVQPRILIVLGPRAEARVWEHYLGHSEHNIWTNAVTEVHLDEGAQLSHVTVQAESDTTVHTSCLSVSAGRCARFAAFAYSQGGASARREMHVHLDGEGSEAQLAGLYLAHASAHHDFQVNLHHNKPHTQSTQNFRGILRDHTTGVFSGTVYVAPGAAKTSAKQLCRNLLLSAQARAHAQPRLEILTDDVKCAHGATVGALDDDALFYLQSRGLDTVQAQTLLTYAFAAEALADAPKGSYAPLAQAVRTRMGLTDLGDSAC